ncbi:MAG: transketolase C-terminal domain-containing protein [Clostridia bacterium]|nr:transketolase C-terminal domain-containing protein [Clostridia bacterium]MDD4387201.1 transketolase C-terminal domain-containing protein [Clostridia bacterium]
MKSTRKAYGEFLVELGRIDSNVIVFDADLAKATCTDMFKKEFPNRHFDIGISEQDMVGTACGAALSGKTVFASTFAMFLAGRAYEQVRNTAAYSHVNINLCATHSGLAVGEDGPTHQCIEDISLMRVIPEMTVLSPADDISTKKILNECLKLNGPKYVRLGRSDTLDIYSENDIFEIGKSKTFGNGINGTIFATGNTLSIALEAKQELEKNNIFVRVVDLYSIKPVDKDNIIKCANESEILVSIEDHSIIGGIGSLVADVLSEYYPKKLIKIGVNDTFGKSGNAKKIYEMFGITKENIISKFV